MAEPTDSSSTPVQAAEPLLALAGLIRDAGAAVSESLVAVWAEELGVGFSSDGELRRQLTRQYPGIVYSRLTKSYSWDDARPERATDAPPTLDELLARWTEELSLDERGQLRDQIGRLISSGTPGEATTALAQALGAIEGSPDWRVVPCGDNLSPAMIDRLAGRAEPSWLLEAATMLPSRRADTPKKRLQALPVVDRNEIAAAAIGRWLANGSPDRPASQRLRRLKAAIGDEFTPLFVGAVVQGAERLTALGRVSDQETQRDLAALAFLLASADLAMAVEAIGHHFRDTESLRRWALAVAAESKSSADRAALITAIAGSEMRAAIFSSDLYQGLDIETLGRMLSQPEFVGLTSGLVEHVRPAVRRAVPAKVGLALAAVATFPVLEPFIPLDLLSNLLTTEEASSRVARAVAGRLVENAVSDERELSERREARLAGDLEALRAKLALVGEQARVAEERAAASQLKLRQAIGHSSAARAAELRQAQIDALRALAETIEETRNVLATLETSALADQHLASAIRRIEAFGVAVEGQPGERVTYDPALHQTLDLEPGTAVELLTPVYRLADSATPLRYGLVRRVSPDG
jgi:hypothetical protein